MPENSELFSAVTFTSISMASTLTHIFDLVPELGVGARGVALALEPCHQWGAYHVLGALPATLAFPPPPRPPVYKHALSNLGFIGNSDAALLPNLHRDACHIVNWLRTGHKAGKPALGGPVRSSSHNEFVASQYKGAEAHSQAAGYAKRSSTLRVHCLSCRCTAFRRTPI